MTTNPAPHDFTNWDEDTPVNAIVTETLHDERPVITITAPGGAVRLLDHEAAFVVGKIGAILAQHIEGMHFDPEEEL